MFADILFKMRNLAQKIGEEGCRNNGGGIDLPPMSIARTPSWIPEHSKSLQEHLKGKSKTHKKHTKNMQKSVTTNSASICIQTKYMDEKPKCQNALVNLRTPPSWIGRILKHQTRG